MSSNIQSKETDRQWNIFSSLAYLYNAFACLADGKLVEKEITKIVEVLLGWTKKEERDLKVIMAFVAQAREWLNEDINNSSEKKDLVNDSLNKCIDVVKNTLAKEQCKIVLNDLVEIGMADGEYDESEKGWVKMISDRLNIEPPTIENFSDKSGQNKNQNTGFPAIVIKKFEDNNKQKAFENFLKRWQDKTNFYNGRSGIISMMPDFFEDIDKSCPKWSLNELDIIVKHSIENKVIPSLAYVPEHFLNLTKQVWWLVPFVIWKGDIASWLLIDKNGFYAPFSDHEDGALIFTWNKIGSIKFEKIEQNLLRMTLFQKDSDALLIFDEFVPNGLGSYLKMIETIYNLNKETIDASRGTHQWYHGAGGEGMKSFENPNDLLLNEKWEGANYPDPTSFGYVDPKLKKEKDKINKILEKSSNELTKEEINQIIKHKGYGKGSKEGDTLILKLVSSENISDSWLEDFALAGLHPFEVIMHIIKNPKTDDYILENLFEREDTDKWSELDRLILSHPNCPKILKNSENTKDSLTLQGQLLDELTQLYPSADVKKIDKGNYLDIHLPDLHTKRGTHIWFNTPKSGGIKFGFFCRDRDFLENAANRSPSNIEIYSNGLRPSGHPTFKEVGDAIKAVDKFIKMIKK